MSDPKSQPRRALAPVAALQAAVSESSGDPLRRAMWLDALEQQLHACLPPPLDRHCRLANVVEGRLVFLVDAPVWHAKLRLNADEIIRLARSIGLDITQVTARISPLPNAPAIPARHKAPPSAASREALQAILDSLDTAAVEDPPASRGDRHS